MGHLPGLLYGFCSHFQSSFNYLKFTLHRGIYHWRHIAFRNHCPGTDVYFDASTDWVSCTKVVNRSGTFITRKDQQSRRVKIAVVSLKHFGFIIKKKGRNLTKSYDRIPLTHRKFQKAKCQRKSTPPKLRLHNDCGPTWDGQLQYRQPTDWCG